MRNILICIIVLLSLESIAQDRVEVSIIEQNYRNGKISTYDPFLIRFSFYKDENDWHIADDTLRSTTGYVCFDGRLIGEINISDIFFRKYNSFKSRYGIDDCSKVPKIGKPSMKFSGWPGYPVYRPLVVSSIASAKDAEHWKPSSPSNNDLVKVAKYMKENILSAVYSDLNLNAIYLIRDINKSYASKDSVKLISLNLYGDYKNHDEDCDEVEDETTDNMWFVIENDRVGYIGYDMFLIDAGDYDNDGRSEIVFKKEQYNYDAYVLFYDLKYIKEFGWNYH